MHQFHTIKLNLILLNGWPLDVIQRREEVFNSNGSALGVSIIPVAVPRSIFPGNDMELRIRQPKGVLRRFYSVTKTSEVCTRL